MSDVNRVDNIDFLANLAAEQGIEIKVSRFTDHGLFLTGKKNRKILTVSPNHQISKPGAMITALADHLLGNRSWTRTFLLSCAGGLAFRRLYGIFL
jgi:hypothetical protein